MRLVILKIKYTSLISIDEVGMHIVMIPLVLSALGHMDMPMKKKFWLVFFNQFPKCLKSLMGKVPPIIELIGRRVGYQYIKTTVPQQFKP